MAHPFAGKEAQTLCDKPLADQGFRGYFLTMPAPLYLVFGSDEYRVATKAKQLIEELVPEAEAAFKLEVVNGAVDTVDAAVHALRQCMMALQTVGLLSSEKVVFFQDVSFLVDNRTGKSETVKEALVELVAFLKKGLSEGQVLVVTAPAADKRRGFAKLFKDAGEIHEYEVVEGAGQSARRELAGRVEKIAAEHQLSMSSSMRDLFLEKVGGNTRQLMTEMGKLAVSLGDRHEVERQDILRITSSSREALAWDLGDAFGKRNLKDALSILRQLLFQKESAIRLVIGLENRVRDLLLYRQALDRGWLAEKGGYGRGSSYAWVEPPPEVGVMLKDHMEKDPRKMHPYRVDILAQQARTFTTSHLVTCLRAAVHAHEQLVSTRIPHETTMELLLIRMLA